MRSPVVNEPWCVGAVADAVPLLWLAAAMALLAVVAFLIPLMGSIPLEDVASVEEELSRPSIATQDSLETVTVSVTNDSMREYTDEASLEPIVETKTITVGPSGPPWRSHSASPRSPAPSRVRPGAQPTARPVVTGPTPA